VKHSDPMLGSALIVTLARLRSATARCAAMALASVGVPVCAADAEKLQPSSVQVDSSGAVDAGWYSHEPKALSFRLGAPTVQTSVEFELSVGDKWLLEHSVMSLSEVRRLSAVSVSGPLWSPRTGNRSFNETIFIGPGFFRFLTARTFSLRVRERRFFLSGFTFSQDRLQVVVVTDF